MPDDLQGRWFEPRVKTKGNADGSLRSTGIGLSICKTIILAHFGSIEGHNNVGAGTEFSFTLPLEEGENNEYSYTENTDY